MAPDVERGLTLDQLRDRCLQDGYPRAEETLARVLSEEVRRGRLAYDAASGCYELNGGLDRATVEALRSLTPPGPSSSAPDSTLRLRRESAGRIAACFPDASAAPARSQARAASQAEPKSRTCCGSVCEPSPSV